MVAEQNPTDPETHGFPLDCLEAALETPVLGRLNGLTIIQPAAPAAELVGIEDRVDRASAVTWAAARPHLRPV